MYINAQGLLFWHLKEIFCLKTFNRIVNFKVRFSLILARCRIFISEWSLESLSGCDRMGVLSWTSSTRNSLYIWRWKHHFWGAIRIVYREFRADKLSNKALIRLNHRSIILNLWYRPYYIIIYRYRMFWSNMVESNFWLFELSRKSVMILKGRREPWPNFPDISQI